MDVSAFFTPPEILNAKRALCIQPHADDNEIGMGGTIAALAAKGCEIHYLTVTNGDLGCQGAPMDPAQLASLRREEAMAAGKTLGATQFHFFDLPDGSLESIPVLAGRIGELVRTIRPDVVFCPDPWARYEAHQDHIVTGKATAQAFISTALAQYPRGTQTQPWQPSAIGFYFTQEPNTVVDVSDTFEKKFAAMALHHTQLNEEMLGLYRVYFTMQAQQRAQGHDFALGEGLKVLGPLHMHCFTEAPQI
ncbi:PIG-L deacetylase family protein [uncultured Ruthenibacterium sp.]|uniref:PIG-L deacetylase family protein n=1 Tax=uncultured Ruthenibacterium sp. TaxID=1905347 RepID=UPI00349ED9FC